MLQGRILSSTHPRVPLRLGYLLNFDELNLYPIHLVRNPNGQIASVMDKVGILTGIINYEIVQTQVRRRLRSVPHSVVGYEDLVRDPERTLGRILEPLGLKFHPRQLAWAEQAKHSVAGNHLRWRTSSELVLDEKWRRLLTPVQRLTIEICTLGSRYPTVQPSNEKRLDGMRWIARGMDHQFNILGTGIRLGWNFIRGLLPRARKKRG